MVVLYQMNCVDITFFSVAFDGVLIPTKMKYPEEKRANTISLRPPSLKRLDNKSRMTGDCHVRFCESLEVKSPWATRLLTFYKENRVEIASRNLDISRMIHQFRLIAAIRNKSYFSSCQSHWYMIFHINIQCFFS